MFTSRAEYRLLLREDNADLRLTEIGRELGLVDDERWARFAARRDAVAAECERLRHIVLRPETVPEDDAVRVFGQPLGREQHAFEPLKRPEVGYAALASLAAVGRGRRRMPSVAEQVETQAKYAGYIARQHDEIERARRHEDTAIPADLDYAGVRGLSHEVRQKLTARARIRSARRVASPASRRRRCRCCWCISSVVTAVAAAPDGRALRPERRGQMATPGMVLVAEGLTVSYPAVGGGEVCVVADLDFEVHAGRTLGIVGESGAGKTQALLAVLGLLPPAARVRGSLRYRGDELVGQPRRSARLLGRRLAWVPQDPGTRAQPLSHPRYADARSARRARRHARPSGAHARNRDARSRADRGAGAASRAVSARAVRRHAPARAARPRIAGRARATAWPTSRRRRWTSPCSCSCWHCSNRCVTPSVSRS